MNIQTFRQSSIFKFIKLFINFLIPLGLFFCLEYFTHDFTSMAFFPMLFNYLIFLFLGIFLSALTGSTRITCIILCLFTAITGIANYFVMSFRGNPILPWDLNSFHTAMSVADNYAYTFDERFFSSCIGLLLLLFFGLIFPLKFSKFQKTWKLRIGTLVFSFLCLFGIKSALYTTAITDQLLTFTNLFTQWASYRDNGFMVSFIQNTKYLDIDSPDGYDSDKLQEELEAYTNTADNTTADTIADTSPNIIVIMNESFADLSVLHSFGTSEDYMPFIHSLQSSDTAITGNLFVSVCGGNTANTEFEFLTGDTMAFLPSGSVPYQQYITSSLPSFVSSLANQGYTTIAMHPYSSTGWNREKVYSYLGFNKTYFKNSFTNAKIIRKYISDESVYDKITTLTEANNGPNFIFAVTMQNHGGYSEIFPDFPISVNLTTISNHPATENYLSLVKESDSAFEEFINQVKESDEKTIVVMFGDHQPNDFVSNCIANLTGNSADERSLEESQNRYIVPFVIWANYEIAAEHKIITSPNYLNLLIAKTAGVELSPYQKFLSTLSEKLPVLTANVCIDSEGNYSTIKDALGSDLFSDNLNLYQKMQYMHLFDEKNKITLFYENEGK